MSEICSCEEPADVVNGVCGSCLLPIDSRPRKLSRRAGMIFKPEDFNDLPFLATAAKESCASIANRKLQEWLDAAPVVYGQMIGDYFSKPNMGTASNQPSAEMMEEVWIDPKGYLCVFNMDGCKGLLERPMLYPSDSEEPLHIGQAYISDHTEKSLTDLGFEKLGAL